MKQLLFIGYNAYGLFAFRKKCKDLDIQFLMLQDESKSLKMVDLTQYTTDIMKVAANYCIFDVAGFTNPEDIIVEEIAKVKNSINTTVIILAAGYGPDSKIIVSLQAMGISCFIFSTTLTPLQNDLESCINGEYEKISATDQEEIISGREQFHEEMLAKPGSVTEPEAVVESKEKTAVVGPVRTRPALPSEAMQKIAIVGSKPYIGTTTVCLQLVKHLNTLEEYNAAYIEHNNTGYIDCVQQLYIMDAEDPAIGRISLQNMDLYYDIRKLPEVLSRGYSYLIYDYGDITQLPDYSSILEKDIILLIGGIKANERVDMTEAMKMVYDQKNVFYLFNHVPAGDREYVRKEQAEKAVKTYFMPYTPDPFTYNPDTAELFNCILQSDYQRLDVTGGKGKKIRRLFAGRG